MKNILYRMLPICLFTIGLTGCEDETKYRPLPEAVPLTMSINEKAFVMGENLKVNIVLSSEYVHNHVPFSHLVFHQGHVMRLKNQVEIQTFCKNPPSPQEFFKKTFHLSGSTISSYYITRYRMKDVSGILQFPFIAESDKKFSAK